MAVELVPRQCRGANWRTPGPQPGMTEIDASNPLDSFINSLLQSTGQLMLIVDHMARHPNEEPDAEGFDDVLRHLLRGTLEDALGGRDPADLAGAAALLADTRELIAAEIFLAEPEELANGSCGGRSRAMTQQFKRGDKVEWNFRGRTVRGTVRRRLIKRTEIDGRPVAATREDPRYVVRSDKSGKETTRRAAALRAAPG